jgi:S-DNA-T family DNA segregation ATPase FtsK/SpoIIIE
MRVLDRLEAEQELRAERARSAGAGRLGPDSGLPMVMLLVANYGGFTAHIEESQQFELGARIERLVRDGAQLGMFVVLSANHERGVPSRLAGQIQSRLVMRRADPTSYTAFGLRTRDIPELGRGRAIDVASGAEVQIAQAAAVAPGPGQEPRCPGRAGGPPPLRCLANDVAPEGLVDRSRELKGGLSLVIGRRHRDLEPATFGLRAGTNLIVSGPPGSGKTTALRALAAAALAADPAGQTILIGPQEEWPGGVEQLGADLIDAERRSLCSSTGWPPSTTQELRPSTAPRPDRRGSSSPTGRRSSPRHRTGSGASPPRGPGCCSSRPSTMVRCSAAACRCAARLRGASRRAGGSWSRREASSSSRW